MRKKVHLLTTVTSALEPEPLWAVLTDAFGFRGLLLKPVVGVVAPRLVTLAAAGSNSVVVAALGSSLVNEARDDNESHRQE